MHPDLGDIKAAFDPLGASTSMHLREVPWTGNSAKAKTLALLLERAADRNALVFDYGCGSAERWRPVLGSHPQLRLIGYDPDKRAIQQARAHLQARQAEFFSGDEIEHLSFSADFILSLSVLEHVFDVRAYLLNAKRLLAPDGLFFLNYDDGHFRNFVDLSSPRSWYVQGRTWIHNLIAPAAARLGCKSIYQRRIRRQSVDREIESIGFVAEESFYSNLRSFRDLGKSISPSRREEFARYWIEVEDHLNSHFMEETSPRWGDAANLWRVMASRTLVLKHGPTN